MTAPRRLRPFGIFLIAAPRGTAASSFRFLIFRFLIFPFPHKPPPPPLRFPPPLDGITQKQTLNPARKIRYRRCGVPSVPVRIGVTCFGHLRLHGLMAPRFLPPFGIFLIASSRGLYASSFRLNSNLFRSEAFDFCRGA